MAETAGESKKYHLGWRLARYVNLLVVVFIIGFLSLTKGWFSFVAVPLLLAVVPTVAWAQISTDLRLAKGTAHPSMSRWAGLQLAGAFVGYFVMPAVGDGHPADVYIVDGPAARAVFLTLTAASAIVFLVACVKFFNASRAEAPPAK
jgi:hypothetical protein